jgi:hypothetical protein
VKYFLILVFLIYSESIFAKAFSIKRLKPTGVQFLINPFLLDCRNLLNTSPLLAGVVQIHASSDPEFSSVLYMGLKLKPGYAAYMTDGKVHFKENGKYETTRFSNEDIELKADENGIAAITIPYSHDENGMRIPMVFRLPDGARFSAYMQVKIIDEENLQAFLVPVVTIENQKGLCLKSQAWLGIGGSFFSYDQHIPESSTNAKFSSLTPLSISAELKYFATTSWAFIASYKSAPGQMKSGAASTTIPAKTFKWDILQLEAQYRPYNSVFAHNEWTFYPFVKFGAQDHQIPRLAIDDNDIASMETIHLTNAHIGLGLNAVDKSNYFLETYLNYQTKVSSTGYTVNPEFMIDGSIGAGKMLTKNIALGLFWYGQWHQLHYRANSGIDQKSGKIQYLFSNFDVRIGWIF